MERFEDLTLPQEVVLLGVATLDGDDETPAPVNVVTRHCQRYAETVPDLGKLTEAEVDRALNVLDAEDIVDVPAPDETSPVGKGRPVYELVDDRETVLDALAADGRLTEAVDQLQEKA